MTDLQPGDPVRVLPSEPGRRDGFEATFRALRTNRSGVTEVEVFGGRNGRAAIRTFLPDRVRPAKKRRVA